MLEVNQSGQSELVFGLVGPAGVRLGDLCIALEKALSAVGYSTISIRLSALLDRALVPMDGPMPSDEAGRLTYLQKKGNCFREAVDEAALARAGIVAIREERAKLSGGDPNLPGGRVAYIVRQLKHPAEVELLRRVYGNSFVLIAGHAPRDMREGHLADVIARKHGQPGLGRDFRASAMKIINDDESQRDDFGQQTRDTYPLADFFADLTASGGEHEVERYIELLFGHPFHTPTKTEYAMYQASAASLRSSDDSRQVGAVIAVRDADIIAVGMNEVPRAGGGMYWHPASPDFRDQALVAKGEDRPKEIKASALVEIIKHIRERKWFGDVANAQTDHALATILLPHLRGTQFISIGEFGRTVHAEMAALLDAARRGVSVNGHSMYVTTFPCHNCAKHIIAAGIREVIYLEPYPKSRADHLHGEEIELEPAPDTEVKDKVLFRPFTGVAPRQYHRLFAMADRGAKKGRSLMEWNADRKVLLPRYVSEYAYASYVQAEGEELARLPSEKFEMGTGREADACGATVVPRTKNGRPGWDGH